MLPKARQRLSDVFHQLSTEVPTRHMFSICSNSRMTDRPASWRMPTPKQMEKLANSPLRTLRIDDPPPDGELPAEYWDAVLRRLDAVKLYGPHATWREVGERLLADGCQVRTGRHEEDGCWPDFGK
jgi:hypothetical protein